MKKRWMRTLALVCALALLAGCAGAGSAARQDASGAAPGEQGEQGGQAEPAAAIVRPLFAQDMAVQYDASLTPAVPAFTVEADNANIINMDQFEYQLDDGALAKLRENGFVVLYDSYGGGNEFFDLYESNRYALIPSFVTSDAMMHTYHLYFAYLLRTAEKTSLRALLADISGRMQAASEAQLAQLTGTAWEGAAKRNLAFFSVGLALLDAGAAVPAAVQEPVAAELSLIGAAGGIAASPVMNLEAPADGTPEPLLEDYTQYIPRGYYDQSAELQSYFRAMMWYGRLNFRAADESQNRSALLMNLALEESGAKEAWENLYTVTSFFAGASDDAGPYEYRPVIESAYGGWPAAADLPGNESAWESYRLATASLAMPHINSIPLPDGLSAEERAAGVQGFRFMGQRFVLDAAIFEQLIYSTVGENAEGGQRRLPSALDVPAALGSAAARDILREAGADGYAGYTQNMAALQSAIAAAPDTLWTASLYGGWLGTLRPLLEEKGAGWPQFMQNEAWRRKSLTTFLGSWTELKHDTVLYAKQVMAEMGGGPIDPRDDRGYVEPQPEFYARLAALCDVTRDGLAQCGILGDADAENLSRLSELAHALVRISEKELQNTLLDEDEYELIRSFGGQLEHFWYDAMKDEAGEEYFSSQEYPSALVTDVATDPDGQVLEVGTGGVRSIFVVVDVGGSLRIARGGVYSFYEFPWPMDSRLTDTEWRDKMGVTVQWTESGVVPADPPAPRPAWTDVYVAQAP